MKNFIIPLEVLIIATAVITWRLGIISLARLGDVMIALGVLGLLLVVLAALNFRVPLGDVSEFRSLNEMEAIARWKAKPSVLFVLKLFVLILLPLTVGILIRLFS